MYENSTCTIYCAYTVILCLEKKTLKVHILVKYDIEIQSELRVLGK